MEPASLSISFDYKLSPQKICNFRELLGKIISFYCYKDVIRSDVSVSYYPTEEKRVYTFHTYDSKGIIMIPAEARLKILNLSLENYIGMKFISHSILAFMTSLSEKVTFFYKSWGVLTEESNLDIDQIRNLRKEIQVLEESYCYFRKSPSVLVMADELNIYHDIFDKYVIIKRNKPDSQIMGTLANILLAQ